MNSDYTVESCELFQRRPIIDKAPMPDERQMESIVRDFNRQMRIEAKDGRKSGEFHSKRRMSALGGAGVAAEVDAAEFPEMSVELAAEMEQQKRWLDDAVALHNSVTPKKEKVRRRSMRPRSSIHFFQIMYILCMTSFLTYYFFNRKGKNGDGTEEHFTLGAFDSPTSKYNHAPSDVKSKGTDLDIWLEDKMKTLGNAAGKKGSSKSSKERLAAAEKVR